MKRWHEDCTSRAAMKLASAKARAISLATSLLAVALVAGCTQCSHGAKRLSEARDPHSGLAPVALPPENLRPASGDARPALILDERRLGHLREAAKRETPAFRRTRALCDEQAKRPVRSGYQGWDWADAIGNLSLCWHATGDDAYARAAVGYLKALLDDRFAAGDGKGGAGVVRHDSGYGIRTFGAYTALAYDWLRGAPGMTPALRKRAIERLDAWLSWYGESGYLNDHPLANYFWGYLTTLALAGLAVGEDDPRAAKWRAEARRLLSERVLPAFDKHLPDGNWPEGWQYGEYVAVQAALVSEAYASRAGVPLGKQLPWFREIVHHHMHALAPDRRSVYGGGTWGERPPKPSAQALLAAAVVLDRTDPERAAEARWLAEHAFPPLTRERAWVALLAERPGGATRDPRQGAVRSRLHAGTGLTLMRSDWSDEAVWVAFQAGPRLTPDHQHKDQGHFELTRGSDWLLVDAGDSEGSATVNHNCLLIDDGGRLLTYSPNQAVWGTNVKTTRFADSGDAVVAVGDLADAWAPACVREGCSERLVESAVRTLVYVRPGLLVIEDRVGLERGDVETSWNAHLAVAPRIDGSHASARVGNSRVDVFTLEPPAATLSAKRASRSAGGPHEKSSPWGEVWRLVAGSERGAKTRRFLHWIHTDDAAAKPAVRPALLTGDGLRGASDGSTAVVFAEEADGGRVRIGATPRRLIVAGLEPRADYRAHFVDDGGCTLELSRGGPERANAGGFVSISAKPCAR